MEVPGNRQGVAMRLVRDQDTQQRLSYRVRAAGEVELVVWKIADGVPLGDSPLPGTEIPAELLDLCATGLGLLFRSQDGCLPKLATNQRLRILLRWSEGELLLDGRVRHIRALSPRTVRVGVALGGGTGDTDQRAAINRLGALVADLHRAELRRRTGVMV